MNEFCIFIDDQKPENTKQKTKHDKQPLVQLLWEEEREEGN